MHTRRLVAFLLGVWLSGLLFVACTTNANFYTTKNILDNSGGGPRQLIELSGKDRATLLLNYAVAEMNRSLIESWEWVQLGLALALVGILPFALRLKWGYLIAAVIMLLISLADRTLLTPQMVGVGRLIDMAGGDAWTRDELWKERGSLYALQMLYWSGEIIKSLVGIGLTGALLMFRGKSTLKSGLGTVSGSGRRRRRSGEKMDSVDDPDYSHVNG